MSKQPDNKLTCMVGATVTPLERRHIKAHAERNNLTVSAFIRKTIAAYMDLVERKHDLVLDDKGALVRATPPEEK